MSTGIVILILAGIIVISFAIWQAQPKEVKEDVLETIDKSLSRIENKTTETKVINETKVKEIEYFLNNITKVPANDKTTIKEQLLTEEWIPIIVRVKNFDLIDEVISSLDKNEFKLTSKTEFKDAIPTFSGNATKNVIIKLQNNIHVEKIYYDYPTKLTLQDSTSLINANKLWQIQLNGLNVTGQLSDRNITVCVIDTGVNYTHPDLGGCPQTNNINTAGCSKIIGGHDYDAFPDDDNPMDTNGHGTHIAGIVAANSSIKGVAPDAKLVALRATGVTNIKNAIDWCVNNRITYNISIITISQAKAYANGSEVIFSSNCDGEDAMVDAANSASQYGVFVDAASGNFGSKSGITDPACGSNVTSVGATYDANVGSHSWCLEPSCTQTCTDSTTLVDKIACFTNRANLLDLLAPGSVINSTNMTFSGDTVPTYGNKSGTSQSAPHVAGVAALMKQANNTLIPAEIENLLKKTGKPIYDNYTNLTFRRVDALKAVLASYNPLVITDLQILNENVLNIVSEFRIFNAVNTTLTDVYWTFDDGNGTIYTNKNNQNITLKPYEEIFVYLQHNYSAVGNFIATAYANSSGRNSNSQETGISVEGTNLNLTNFTSIHQSGTQRIFEFFIGNDGTHSVNNVYWNMTVTGEGDVNSTEPITLASGERIFVYVNYNYTTGGSHNVTVKVDPSNIIGEDNENDNEGTIINN